MAERLTNREVSKSFTEQELKTSEQARIYQKLGKLEDILEKYGIESLDTLEHVIKKGQVINTTIEGFAKEAYNEMEQDRDTWKRAFEWACKKIVDMVGGVIIKKEDVSKILEILNAKECIICSDGENILKFTIIKVAE